MRWISSLSLSLQLVGPLKIVFVKNLLKFNATFVSSKSVNERSRLSRPNAFRNFNGEKNLNGPFQKDAQVAHRRV